MESYINTNHIITTTLMQQYITHLQREERANNTIMKYTHDVRAFAIWLGNQPVTKEAITAWKEYLIVLGRSVSSINGAIAAIHSFLTFMQWNDCNVRYLKVQRQLFRDTSKELTPGEYQCLVHTAEAQGDDRLAMLLETICGTGVRVSEVQYITIEAVAKGQAQIKMKGKIRTILIQSRLAKKLKKYAKKHNIKSGAIFITRTGRPMSRGQIWSEMKALCKAAGVDESKVFPHNLRHLFARTYYKQYKDVVQLADMLGHSSVETTRIYLKKTVEEHRRSLDKLGLVS